MTNVRPCPICSGAANGAAFPFSTEWNGKRFSYVRCAGCATTFVDPSPDEEDFAKMYSKANYHDEHYSVVAVEQYRQSIRILKGLVGDKVSLLDFGCGNGSFISAGKQEGLYCVGVEMDADTIRFAQANSGCLVLTLDALKQSGRLFDVIHLGDVLEHLPQPADLLRDLESLLRPGGMFFVEGPLENNPSAVYTTARLFAWGAALLGRRKAGHHAPTHLFRVDASNQRAFFVGRMKYRERHFAVYETGWPYYNADEPFRLAPGFIVKSTIGLIAVALGGARAPSGGRFGNRFSGLFVAKGPST